MTTITEDTEISPVDIARAFSAAADLRPPDDDDQANFSETLAAIVNRGATLLGRDRGAAARGSLSPHAGADLDELATFNALILTAADFLGDNESVSSRSLSFGVRSKLADVNTGISGVERALMLLAGLIPLAGDVDQGALLEAADAERARNATLRALEYGIAEHLVTEGIPAPIASAA